MHFEMGIKQPYQKGHSNGGWKKVCVLQIVHEGAPTMTEIVVCLIAWLSQNNLCLLNWHAVEGAQRTAEKHRNTEKHTNIKRFRITVCQWHRHQLTTSVYCIFGYMNRDFPLMQSTFGAVQQLKMIILPQPWSHYIIMWLNSTSTIAFLVKKLLSWASY